MTTEEIEALANDEDLTSGANDINLKTVLRRNVVPDFEKKVGDCAWRRVNATEPIVQGDRQYDLPTNFVSMLEKPIYDLGGNPAQMYWLEYIGEEPVRMTLAEKDTEQGTPLGYWIKRVTGPPTQLRSIFLSKIPSAAATLRYSYISKIVFTDNTTSVNMDNYIPEEHQWALVEGLKVYLYRARFGIRDQRYIDAKQVFMDLVEDAKELKEPGRRNKMVRMRMARE